MDKYVNELKHFGRKGMKWYQRIFSKEETGSNASSTESSKSSVSKMSDEELRSKTARIRLENDYNEAISRRSQSSMQSKAKKFLSSHLERIIGNTVDNLGTQALTHTVGNLVNRYNKKLKKNPFNKLSDKKEEREAWYQYDSYHRTVNPQKGQKEK